jgi:alpha-glucosidase
VASSSPFALPSRVHRPWWRDAVVYQIYSRSFADSNGDGVGDIEGVRQHLDYLKWLGVDAIWLTPFYDSPWNDGGYDVANYRLVDPQLGSNDDVERLIASAHELGIKVLADIVPNHSSSEHEWFKEAVARGPESRAAQRYHVVRGKGVDGDEPPNNWKCVFGGIAWSRFPAPAGGVVPGWWYLHLFDATQPDVNWDDPDVRADFIHTLRFWFDRGLDGFRIDVAHGLSKDPTYPDDSEQVARMADVEIDDDAASLQRPQWDYPGNHDIYRDWRVVADAYEPRRVFCGEVWLPDPVRQAKYLRRDELHTAFNFHFVYTPWTVADMRLRIDESLVSTRAVGAPQTWVLSNHDIVRHATRFGKDADGVIDYDLGLRRAKAITTMMMGLPGSAYIYQGEELGLHEVVDLPAEVREDPAFVRTNGEDGYRDGCRVPIPWSGSEPPYGFSPGGAQTWLPQPRSWGDVTVAAEQADPASTLHHYRELLRARKAEPALGDGPMSWVADAPEGVLAFVRPPHEGDAGVVVALNVSDKGVAFNSPLLTDEILVASDTEVVATADGIALPANSAAWVRLAAEA